jgi:hypothetical protein
VGQVSSYIVDYNFTSRYVFNIDETRTESRENSSERFICPTKEGRTIFAPYSDLRTTVNIISADGKSWLTVYLYKDDVTANPDRSGTIPVVSEDVIYFIFILHYYYFFLIFIRDSLEMTILLCMLKQIKDL